MSRESDEIIAALVDLCKEIGVRCLVQIGAEDGWEAYCVHEAIGCRAVCIEGDPKCCRCSPRLEYHRCLIGATDCVTDFYVHEQMGLSSTIPRNDGLEQHVAMEQYRLDTFCELSGITPDALVIDTEGTTMDVLEGASGVLAGVRLIYAEVQTREIRPGVSLLPEVDAFLAERGFVRREGLPAYDAGGQGNFCWVRT